MLTIGEFSASTRLTVKALRMYHDEGIIVPERTDPATGYRYDVDLGIFLKKRLEAVDGELVRMRAVRDRIAVHFQTEKEPHMTGTAGIKDTVIPQTIVCSIRYKRRYDEMGTYFAPLFKKAGRYGSGPAMAFYHDPEYRRVPA